MLPPPDIADHSMKRYRLVFPLIALIVIAGMLLPGMTGLAQSDQPVIIKVSPETIQVAPGETTQFAIEIKDARELYAFDVQLTFDPDVIEIVDADPNQDGVQMSQGTFFDPGFVIRNIADNEAGKLHYAMTQLNPSEAKSGDGVLVVVEIRGKTANATSPLTITKGEVAQRTGQKLPTTLFSGEAEGITSGSASPTVTPIPTQVPGTPLPTAAPTATPGNTSTPQPTATSAPTDTPVPTDTPAPEATSTPQVTPTQQPATPTPLPPTATSPPATDTPTPAPTMTPLPPTATATKAAATATPTPITAASLPDDTTPSAGASPPTAGMTPTVSHDNQSANSNTLLYFGLGLLALALIIGVAIVIIWRQSTT